jgi:hypothetical protein
LTDLKAAKNSSFAVWRRELALKLSLWEAAQRLFRV